MPTEVSDPRLWHLSARHVYDLMAMAIGATGHVQALAGQSSLAAARLEAIKADLIKNAALGIGEIAARHRISPRYVQLLFDRAGTTFSQFTLDLRLEQAHAMLTSPRFASRSVTAIAYEAGFSDHSHFSRRFKQRYGKTPSDLRAER
jgi:AraC-like DNA-binding protein